MAVENDKLDTDADMSGGVVQSDVTAEDPGREARKRAVCIYLIAHIGTLGPALFY